MVDMPPVVRNRHLPPPQGVIPHTEEAAAASAELAFDPSV
jgi:hypothetical protein